MAREPEKKLTKAKVNPQMQEWLKKNMGHILSDSEIKKVDPVVAKMFKAIWKHNDK